MTGLRRWPNLLLFLVVGTAIWLVLSPPGGGPRQGKPTLDLWTIAAELQAAGRQDHLLYDGLWPVPRGAGSRTGVFAPIGGHGGACTPSYGAGSASLIAE